MSSWDNFIRDKRFGGQRIENENWRWRQDNLESNEISPKQNHILSHVPNQTSHVEYYSLHSTHTLVLTLSHSANAIYQCYYLCCRCCHHSTHFCIVYCEQKKHVESFFLRYRDIIIRSVYFSFERFAAFSCRARETAIQDYVILHTHTHLIYSMAHLRLFQFGSSNFRWNPLNIIWKCWINFILCNSE